jgi:hypothetical protein
MSIRNRDTPFVWDPASGLPPLQLHPRTPKRSKNTSRDQRRDVQMAYICGFDTAQIMKQLHLTRRQVLFALDRPPTPKKSTGRPPTVSPEQRQSLVTFVCASKKNRRMSYKQLAKEFDFWDVGHKAIKAALDLEGFSLCWAMRKPPISEKNRKLHLKFCREHLSWKPADWAKFLWTDETWVKDGRHRKTRILRRPREEWDDTCVEDKVQRKKGWMFWGAFHGNIKGPAMFWEKDWGSISGPTYRQYTVPIIAQYLCDIAGLKGMENELIFMQDNAPGHAAKETIALLNELAILTCKWPPYSPDLNPIETLWKHMKEWLQYHYGDDPFKSYAEQKEKITRAWNAVVTPGLLEELIESMPARMEAVIAAKGKFTKY